MAARVGTGVTGTGGATPASSVASAAKSTTTGNTLVVFIKWETVANPNVTSVTDTAGNTFVEIAELANTSGAPYCSMYYAENITGNASNVVTANFGSASTDWSQIIVEEFSGLATSSSLDGSQQTDTGTGTSYSTPNITTTTTGLVVLGVAGFTGLGTWDGTPATPDFTVGATVSDSALLYLISGSAQTVTPAASADIADRWNAFAQAFKDAAGGGGPGSGSDTSLIGVTESTTNLIQVRIIEETS